MVFRYKLSSVSTFYLFSDLKRMLRCWIKDKKWEFAIGGGIDICRVMGRKLIYVYKRGV